MAQHPLSITGNITSLRPVDIEIAIVKAKQIGINVSEDKTFQAAFRHLFDEFKKREARYSPSTLKRLESAWGQFVAWCHERRYASLPAEAIIVEEFFVDREPSLHRNTLSIYRWAISRVHRIAGCPDPCHDTYVDDRLKAIRRTKVQKGEIIKQASPFNEQHLDHIIDLWQGSQSLRLCRNLVLLAVAYESMLRAAELANIQLQDIEFMDDGSAVLLVPISKTNHSGEPDTKFLSPQVVELIHRYIQLAEIDSENAGYLFVGISKHNTRFKIRFDANTGLYAHQPISTKTVEGVFHSAWEVLESRDRPIKPFTAHSARVGATQDLLRKGFDVLQVQQSGGWASSTMVFRYGRAILAREGAMARSRTSYSKRN
ncbi:tyrosine-type recombinase/integrase [Vibrio profundum]|uniref:tyrosine-type recombinase/integrase n=1 Tax=Vibrio profundum TaxID=2910247 RepID=UPI003D0C6CB9